MSLQNLKNKCTNLFFSMNNPFSEMFRHGQIWWMCQPYDTFIKFLLYNLQICNNILFAFHEYSWNVIGWTIHSVKNISLEKSLRYSDSLSLKNKKSFGWLKIIHFCWNLVQKSLQKVNLCWPLYESMLEKFWLPRLSFVPWNIIAWVSFSWDNTLVDSFKDQVSSPKVQECIWLWNGDLTKLVRFMAKILYMRSIKNVASW